MLDGIQKSSFFPCLTASDLFSDELYDRLPHGVDYVLFA